MFVEVGPKKALHGFVEDALGRDHDDVVALFTNHPKQGDIVAFNQALCGLYAAGLGTRRRGARRSRGGAGAHRPVAVPEASRPRRRSRRCPTTATASSGTCWPTSSTAAGRCGRDPPPTPHPHRSRSRRGPLGARGRHGRGPRPPRHRAGLRRRQPRPHPRRAAVHRPDPPAAPGGHGRQAHHPARQERARRSPVRGHRQPRRRHQAGGPRRRVRPRRGVRRRRRPRQGARRLHAAGHRRRVRRAARRRHPAGACATRRPRSARSSPSGGVCPARCATTPASSSPRPSPATASSPGTSSATSPTASAATSWPRCAPSAPPRRRRGRAEIDRRIGEVEAAIEAEPFEFDRRFLFRILAMGHSQFAEIIGARARTRRSTPPAPAPPRPSAWPRTGSGPVVAGGS